MALLLVASQVLGWPARADVPWTWPVVGPIVRGFDPPDDPYGSGHRGIDIGADVGIVIVAPDDGVVSFAGKVGGKLFLTIDHGGGVSSTCSWLSAVMVRKGDRVVRGQPVALTGWGHTDLPAPQLHLGVRLDGTYVDPLDYLGTPPVADLIRLAPIDAAAPAARVAAGRMTGLAYPTTARAARGDVLGAAGGPSQRGFAERVGRPVAAVPGQRTTNGGRTRRRARATVRPRVGRPRRHR
jgi:hypothetical protein